MPASWLPLPAQVTNRHADEARLVDDERAPVRSDVWRERVEDRREGNGAALIANDVVGGHVEHPMRGQHDPQVFTENAGVANGYGEEGRYLSARGGACQQGPPSMRRHIMLLVLRASCSLFGVRDLKFPSKIKRLRVGTVLFGLVCEALAGHRTLNTNGAQHDLDYS